MAGCNSMTGSGILSVVCTLMLSLIGPQASPDDDDVLRMAMTEQWTTAFADEDIRTGVRVSSDASPAGTLQWTHSANQRTLARGEAALSRSDDQSSIAEIVLRAQPLRDGVILSTVLTAQFMPAEDNQIATNLEHTITLFPRDPLADRVEWAKELDLEVFETSGKTCRAFDELHWPYRAVRNTASLNDSDRHGVLIIGEGISLDKNRLIADAVLQAAKAGRRVLLLAPADGTLPVPGMTDIGLEDKPLPGELRFARQQVITQLDKRLDAEAWQGTKNAVPSRRMAMEIRRGQIITALCDRPDAWPWMEIRYPETQGILIVCGFQIIDHWNNGPTPRYLLVRMLETMSKTDP